MSKINLNQDKRCILIDAIIKYDGSKYENKEQLIKLSKDSMSGLNGRFQGILEWYKNENKIYKGGYDKQIEEIEEILRYLFVMPPSN